MSEFAFLRALILVCGTVAFVAALGFLRRILGRFLELKHEQRIPVATDGIHERLERIEQAIEATAIEVERIAEGNRFMAKLLAERAGAAIPAKPPERVITPH
jgi:hypothetical protein